MSILTWIGFIGSIVSIAAGILTFFIWLKVRWQNKKIKEMSGNLPEQWGDFKKSCAYHSRINSSKPYAFCLSLTDRSESIRSEVEKFLKKKKWTDMMKIEELNFNGLTPKNFPEFFDKLKLKRRELSASGATEIHLFISGPMQAAVLIGSMFSNWIPVKVYNLNPNTREYEYWCFIFK